LADYFTSQGHNVLYVSGPMNIYNLRYFIMNNPSKHDLKYGLRTWLRGGFSEAPNLLSYAPMTFLPIWRKSIFASRWVARNTLKFTRPNLMLYIARHGFAHPDVLLVSQPFFAELLHMVGANVKVYRITDDIDKFPSIPASICYLEKEAAQRADAVVVTSRPLIEKMKNYGAEGIHYVPNGVDYDHYQQVEEKPEEYRHLVGPIAVYMGAIDSWFSIDTLIYSARALPWANFVLIGKSRIDLSPLDGLSNVWYLGHKQYTNLPSYLQYASVGIIPFKVTPLINSVSPLKLYEYMACGLPVVTSRWQELENIDSPAYLADDKESFVTGINSALTHSQDKNVFKKFAAQNSWKSRGGKLENLFIQMLAHKISHAG
jgi:glycosyltransferase involved in cell wall biosynthesis